MSSLRNAVKRKTHKERSTPIERRKLGLLERKKDYKARADDFHRKEKALEALQRKAEERNPDEFYFGMEHARTRGGVHVKSATQANKYSQEQLQLMKGQDIKYVALKSQSEAKKVERLRRSLHFIGAPQQSRHTVFLDGEDAPSFSPQRHFDTPAELLSRAYNRPRNEQLSSAALVSSSAASLPNSKKLDRKRASTYKELLQREERHSKLGSTVAQMELEKAVMGKGRKRKISQEGEAPAYRWKQQRKK
ncbi:g4918 [Coccomyxa viridis]|uniref:U3 small nucleolar RNA-associated protein 11 n=1 Tax=Coccomyxa viridis TaxID=1274662 RepID=A0ABP1FRI6_9CHLO